MKKNTLTILLFSIITSIAHASNQVYIEQVGDSSTINITQEGTDNRIGTTLENSYIGGGSNTVIIDQIGSGNELDFTVNGVATDVTLSLNGNNNVQAIICGSLGTASCSGSSIVQNITGDSNTTTVNLGSGANHSSTLNITGDTNIVTHTSTSTGITSADVTVVGNTNTIGVTQSGTLTNSVTISSTGNNNVVSVVQSN